MTQEEYLIHVQEVNKNKKYTQIQVLLEGRKQFNLGTNKDLWKIFSVITDYNNPIIQEHIKEFEMNFHKGNSASTLTFTLNKGDIKIAMNFTGLPVFQTQEEIIDYLSGLEEKQNPTFIWFPTEDTSSLISEEDFLYILSLKEGEFLNPYENKLEIPNLVDISSYDIIRGMPFDSTSPFQLNGEYYAWAETSPKLEYTLENYNPGHEYSENEILSDVDDIVSIEARIKDRYDLSTKISSPETFQQVIDGCNYTWTTANGCVGAKFTPKLDSGIQGKYLFIPALQHSDPSYYTDEVYCAYWTNTSDEERTTAAQLFYCSERFGPNVSSTSRYFGLPLISVKYYPTK